MKEKLLIPLVKKIKSFYPQLGVVLLFVGLLVCLFIFPYIISADGEKRFQFMETLINQFHIVRMKYSMVGPLFSLPLWLISSLLRLKDPSSIVERYNFLLFIFLLFILFLWLKKQFDKQFLLTFFLILAFGSMFPAHLINYFGEVFSAVCLTLGSVSLSLNKKWVGWSLLILAVLNTPALLVPFTLVVLYITWESKKVRHLLIIPACVILMVVESYLRTHSFTAGFLTYLNQDQGHKTVLPYSGKVGFSYPFVFGILSILLSFGKGLIFFCPGLLLIGWTWKYLSDPVERKMFILWFLIVLGLIVVYAPWWSWYGGAFWGPRFFLFACVPASWILARLLYVRDRSLALSVFLLLFVTLSFWVGVNGVVFNQKTLDICFADNYALESLCWYVPEFSALWRPFVVQEIFSKRLPLLFAIIWLYVASPLGVALFHQLRTALQADRFHFRMSSWKF